MNKLKKALKKPSLILLYLLKYRPFNLLSDKKFIKLEYYLRTGKQLSFEQPKTFNEKLQWLKLKDINPLYTQLVDKYEVRKYISESIGKDYLIPLYGVYNRFEEIDFDELPRQFVLKPNHTSGDLFICKDKNKINYKVLKRNVNKWLRKNYFWIHREWPYKNVKPRIIVEQYINQIDDNELRDYRFFCFNGEPKFIAVDFSINDKSKTRRNLYDLDWNLLPATISYPNELDKEVKKPDMLDEMISLSRILSKNIPHVRVDFYNIDKKIIFGEMTFYHQSGFGKVDPSEFEMSMGEWLKLPKKM